jgi:hypothetical protein
VDLDGYDAIDIASGFASSVVNLLFADEVSASYIKTFEPEHADVVRESTGTFDEIYNNKYQEKYKVDFRSWSIKKSYAQSPTLGEKLKSIATLGIPETGEAIGRTAGAIAVSTDESMSADIRNQADFDVGTQGPDIFLAIAAKKGRIGKTKLQTQSSVIVEGNKLSSTQTPVSTQVRGQNAGGQKLGDLAIAKGQRGAVGPPRRPASNATAQNAGESLYRGMKAGPNGPETGPSARTLGARPNQDIPVDCNGCVHPGTGGMSVAPNTPKNLPAHRRPPEHGGTGKDPVWSTSSNNLGSDLKYVQDKATHGTIQPSRSMTLEEYQKALSDTNWSKQ